MLRGPARPLLHRLAFSAAAVLCLGMPSDAQLQPPLFDQLVRAPNSLPGLPPEGAWGEIINATPRWVVIQNHAGQQFPISVDAIGQFLTRWPSSIDALGPQSVVEA